jgi:hypothetical protein
METTPKEFYPYVGVGVVSWTGGGAGQGHTVCMGVLVHGAYVAQG